MSYGFLFDPTDLPVRYGDYVRNLVFRSGLLKLAQRELLIRVGDLLLCAIPSSLMTLPEVASRLSASNRLEGFMRSPLDEVLASNRTYAFAIEGLTETEAKSVHSRLLGHSSYRGCFGVDLGLRLHQWLFEIQLIQQYRISGERCWTTVEDEVDELAELGFFSSVNYARGF